MGSYGLNVVHGFLTPDHHLECYGMQPDEFDVFMASSLSAIGVNTILLLYLQFMQSMPFEKAVGWHTLPSVYQEVKKLVLCKHDEVGMKKESSIIGILLNLGITYACLSGASFASPLIKFYGLWSLANSIPMMLAPEATVRIAHGLEPKTGTNTMLLSHCGGFMFAHGTAISLQAFDVTTSLLHTIGWTSIVVGFFIGSGVLTKRFENAGVENRTPAKVYVVLTAVLGASMLTDGNIPDTIPKV